jgi:hypothetical protein
MPLVDFAERDFVAYVVRFDALEDLLCHLLLPLPAARPLLTQSGVVLFAPLLAV